MATTISGTAGVTFPAGGLGNPAGAVVGTTDTQTLTNKTLTSPTITGAVVSSMGSSVITSGTAVASTSGTSIDFTSIPSWVKRITVMLSGVSTSGTSLPQIQIGAGSITTTGYVSWASVNTGTNTVSINSSTTGFHINSNVAANVLTIQMVITLVSSNAWIETHSGIVNSGQTHWGGANLTLAGTLDRVRITTVNGTDTFDAGSINILYE